MIFRELIILGAQEGSAVFRIRGLPGF